MAALASSPEFYVSGGTMPEEAPSYVERAADRQLLKSLLAGKYCYVLNSRQMGKSSMCVRTKLRLEQERVATAFVDLTKIGGRNVTAEQWYAGLTVEVGRSLDLRSQLLAYWKENSHLSPMQRFFGALREVALEQIGGAIVVFVDEIDATRSLSFDTDEFFAGIRECHNRRVHDSAYQRLTFCLLGVAVPSDLIRNAQTTPFNVGERIYLRDFTLEEAGALAKGLPGRESLVQRVHYWTNGHPFLTQSLCTALRNDPSLRAEKDVDTLVARDLFEPQARDTNINLADVGNRVLNGYAEGDDVNQFRADILSAYEKALKGKELADDESNRTTAILKLSGLMRSEGKSLKVRNRIYERVFDRAWIVENMPAQELRRQHRAFWLGVLRTAAIGALVIALVANLAYRNDQLRAEAARQRDRANYEVYVANMNLLPSLWQRGDIERMRSVLYATELNSARGWEWNAWSRLCHESVAEVNKQGHTGFSLSPDGTQIATRVGDEVQVLDARSLKRIRAFSSQREPTQVFWLPDGKRLAERSSVGLLIRDANSGETAGTFANLGIFSRTAFSPDGIHVVGNGTLGQPIVGDLRNFSTRPISGGVPNSFAEQYSQDGKVVAWVEGPQTLGTVDAHVVVRSSSDWSVLTKIRPDGTITYLMLTPNGQRLATGNLAGLVQYWDVRSGKELWRMRVQDREVMALAFSEDGKRMGASGRDRHAHVFDVFDTGLRPVRGYSDGLSIALNADGSRAYVDYWTLREYDLTRPSAPLTVSLPKGQYVSHRVLVDQAEAIYLSADLKAWRVDLAHAQNPHLVTGIPGVTISVAGYHPWAFFNSNGKLGIWDFAMGRLVRELPLSPVGQDFYVESPDGSTLLHASPQTAEIWEIAQGKRIAVLPGLGFVNRPNFSPDGTLIAEGLNDGRMNIIDLKTKTQHQSVVHLGPIFQVTFSRDGKKMITAADDDSAAVLDVATGKVLFRLTGHSQSVRDADISPDGRRFVTSSDDETVRLWDGATGRELTVLEGYKGPVYRARFSADGKTLFTLTRDGVVKIWPTEGTPTNQ